MTEPLKRYYAARVTKLTRRPFLNWEVGAYFRSFTADELDPQHEKMGPCFGGLNVCGLEIAWTEDRATAQQAVDDANSGRGVTGVKAELAMFELREIPRKRANDPVTPIG